MCQVKENDFNLRIKKKKDLLFNEQPQRLLIKYIVFLKYYIFDKVNWRSQVPQEKKGKEAEYGGVFLLAHELLNQQLARTRDFLVKMDFLPPKFVSGYFLLANEHSRKEAKEVSLGH